MSRSFSLVGLPKEFETFKQEKKLKVIKTLPFKEYFYSDGYAMKVYQDQEGEVYQEFECGCPWESGPMLYLGLQKENGEVLFKWSNSSMGFYEDVALPSGYNEEIAQGFITEYDLPLVKGYCPLYVHKDATKVYLYQDVLHKGDPNNLYKEIKLFNPEDGAVIIDWLHQQGFSVEETELIEKIRHLSSGNI